MDDFELDGSRYEIKMVYENLARFQAEGWVQTHPCAFYTAYPSRQVNNIYFDTASMDTFTDHVAGVEHRRKLRFRWYGEDLTVAQGHMELKHKQGNLGWKTSQGIDQALLLEENNWGDIQQGLLQEATGVFREGLSVSRPVLINCYERDYFISADGNVRLTLDYDLRGYDQSFGGAPNITFQVPMRDLVIIEVKTAATNERQLADVLAGFSLYVSAFSKYVELTGRILEQ